MIIARQLEGRGACSERQEHNKLSRSYRQHKTHLRNGQQATLRNKYQIDLDIKLKTINFIE